MSILTTSNGKTYVTADGKRTGPSLSNMAVTVRQYGILEFLGEIGIPNSYATHRKSLLVGELM